MPTDPRRLTFTIPALPPRELWANQDKPGPAWTTRAWLGHKGRLSREYAQACYLCTLKAIRESHGWRAPNYVTMVLTFVFPDGRRRDLFNVAHAMKSGIDAMVKAGLMYDDGTPYLDEATLKWEQVKGREAVRVTVTEVI
ncbi:hypothetical protein LCGC14_2250720 [marine sediment metagenome]|uniref:Uncharacterized protein n=1 Tax=marine sediment metagenome TaxID=412755 RepID=A0A0F9FF71_9ZZZZ